DVQEIKELIPSNDFGGMVSQTTYKYTATALAIKYTEAIINTDGITHSQVSGNSNMLIPLIPEITPETQKKSQSPQARMMYLGGFISLGGASWNEEYNNFGNIVSRSNGSPLVSGGVVFNFVPLRFALSNIFAFKLGLETMLGITYEFDGGGIYPIIPIQATVGADIGPVGFSVNAGYAILMGLAWGATLDVNLGSGKLFLQYLAVPSVNPDTTGIDGVTVNKAAVGYKFGLGK
ncbi:MAG: hypothetical protein FWC03_05900, partial [Treponema sp.]|nr:hypothetical protein [Treponema sp.]